MKKNNEFLKEVLVWICAAGVILALLVPCFSLIWRDRNRTHTRDECRLLADAILKQSNVEQKRIRKNEPPIPKIPDKPVTRKTQASETDTGKEGAAQ